jgi:hypothetical protein
MILRPLEPLQVNDREWGPAWEVVERFQRQKYESCWMITQPSHAALAGEIAAKLDGPPIPKLDADLIRAIALHDAGWGMPDAETITHGRSAGSRPKSFLETPVAEFLDAWAQSIQVAQSTGSAGGYIVSRHFSALATHRTLHQVVDTGSERELIQRFLLNEEKRQKRLASRQGRTAEELEQLTQVLQFCDLLSLYICSGARDSVEFPHYFGVRVRLQVEGEGYRLEPALVARSQLQVAALWHPATKERSGKEIGITIL